METGGAARRFLRQDYAARRGAARTRSAGRALSLSLGVVCAARSIVSQLLRKGFRAESLRGLLCPQLDVLCVRTPLGRCVQRRHIIKAAGKDRIELDTPPSPPPPSMGDLDHKYKPQFISSVLLCPLSIRRYSFCPKKIIFLKHICPCFSSWHMRPHLRRHTRDRGWKVNTRIVT